MRPFFAGASVLGLAALLAATPPKPLPFSADWYEPVDPVHIAGPIWYVGTKDLAVYLITTPEGDILLDGAVPGASKSIEDSIKKIPRDPANIKRLLITHAHFDHVGTLAHIKKATGAKLSVMGPDVELLKSGGAKDYLFGHFYPFHFDPVPEDYLPSKPGTFVKEVMNELADLGERMGADPKTWITEAP